MKLYFFCSAFALFSCFSSISAQTNVRPHQFGALARIVVNGKHKCAATVLSRNWVLTAAQCLVGVKYKEIKIVVGDHKLSELDVPEQEVNAKQFIIHQDYDKSNQLHDIAVILVHPAIEFSLNLTCATIPDCGERYLEGWAVGWRKRPSEELSDEPMYGKIYPPSPIPESGDLCESISQQVPNTKYVFCLQGGNNTCVLDTGSPTIFPDFTGKYFGVFSYFVGDCAKGLAVFTNISQYAGWIDRRTRGCGNFPFYPETHVEK